MGLLDERQSKQNLENVGDGVISKRHLIDAGFEIVTCDEEGCRQQAVVVLPDYIKCDEHDKEHKLTELVRSHNKKGKKNIDGMR